MRLVIDTDVFIAGLRSDKGASRQILLLALDRQIVMLASVPMLLEYEAVATRAEQLEQSGITLADANTILDAFAAVIEPVKLRFLWRPRLKDPAGEMVLEAAVNGRADRIATFNTRHLQEAAAVFGIRAALPGEILHKIRGVNHAKE
jgi:putative PIN family toxin of toxin-antitoxin system